MRIKPENVDRYPLEWPAIRARIRTRAENRCEHCGVRNHSVGYRDEKGTWHPLGGSGPCDAAGQGLAWPSMLPIEYREAKGFADAQNDHIEFDRKLRRTCDADGHAWFVIVCTTAHLDHQPENCADDNLRFLCQRCHLSYDAKHHAESAYETRRTGKAVGDLFGG